MGKAFKIFYSWQSDLSPNKTRYFIQDCIDKAISIVQQVESVEAVRDEATNGETGSPDIVATVFNKIDECDLFVADLSLCCATDTDRSTNKRSPNPNVLVELGYAAHSLGWNRIICFCNTEYGDIGQLPFDIQHNRVHGYSLNEASRSRKDVILEQAQFIIHDICALRDQLPRSMQKEACHVLGAFCMDSASVQPVLVPLLLHERIDASKTQALHKTARSLFDEIIYLGQQMAEERKRNEEARTADEEAAKNLLTLCPGLSRISEAITYIGDGTTSQEQFSKPVVARITDKVTDWLDKYIGLQPSEDFFSFGSLRESTLPAMFGSKSYIGSDLEKTKYDKYIQLCRTLFALWLRSEYHKTFEGMLFFPLAIQNVSRVEDQNIRIIVSLREGEPVAPSSELIFQSVAKYAGQVVEAGLIEELFSLPLSEYIEAEGIPVDASRILMPKLRSSMFGQIETVYEDSDRYVNKLNEFIMSPTGPSYYNFSVSSLRAGESRWLCCGILTRPSDRGITLEYTIHSSRTVGETSGILHYEPEA